MSEDRQILKRLQRGDKDALRQLYEKYTDILVSVAVTLVHDVQTAEDCLHDAFIDFAAIVPVLRIHGNLRSYLISCVANRARDLLRKRARSANVDMEQIELASNTNEPSDRLITSEDAKQVFDALVQLPYEQREVFVLHVQGDLTFREIAELNGDSINTVQSRYRYGIEKVRSLLNTECENE
ncbi:MAG: RNA polymerase sigma factor [Sedimentisphaerales bacterium]|jgi:RNA polymerase sigma-70 factor (ECF subfamily)